MTYQFLLIDTRTGKVLNRRIEVDEVEGGVIGYALSRPGARVDDRGIWYRAGIEDACWLVTPA